MTGAAPDADRTRRREAGARAGEPPTEAWHLRLYVAGESPKSLEAFANLKRLCETHLGSRYEIEIVDLLENPRLARGDEIVAIPTLVRRLPAPMRKIIGDLSDTDRVLVGLQLRPASHERRHERRHPAQVRGPAGGAGDGGVRAHPLRHRRIRHVGAGDRQRPGAV